MDRAEGPAWGPPPARLAGVAHRVPRGAGCAGPPGASGTETCRPDSARQPAPCTFPQPVMRLLVTKPWASRGGSSGAAGAAGRGDRAGGGLGRQPGGTAALRRLVLRLSRGARGPALSPERPELTRLPSEMPGRPAARGGTAGARTPGNAGRPPGVSQPRTFTSFVLWVHGQRSNQPVPLSNCPPSPPRGGRSLGGPEGSASFVSCR